MFSAVLINNFVYSKIIEMKSTVIISFVVRKKRNAYLQKKSAVAAQKKNGCDFRGKFNRREYCWEMRFINKIKLTVIFAILVALCCFYDKTSKNRTRFSFCVFVVLFWKLLLFCFNLFLSQPSPIFCSLLEKSRIICAKFSDDLELNLIYGSHTVNSRSHMRNTRYTIGTNEKNRQKIWEKLALFLFLIKFLFDSN